MRRFGFVLIVVAAGCDRPPSSAGEPVATVGTAAAATASSSTTTVAPSASVEPVNHVAEGRCDPTPKAGAPCAKGDSYCVESWGKPGGRSSTLWCRNGHWEREEEDNLP